jgi:exopolyphosphatase/guanosine-5'-triphosphate,3'-diphosphate pyrophosphatase
VGTVRHGRVAHLFAAREPTRLGRGLSAAGNLNRASIRRTTAAVSKLAAEARRHHADEVIGVGTYAFRAARNGRAAARLVATGAGIPVRILSGAQESAMVLRSVRARLPKTLHHLLVVDIGGGSAELIVSRHGRATLARSLPLGAVRLTELFLKSDPILPDEYARLVEHVDAALTRLFSRVDPAHFHLVVSGGTATTAAMMLGRNAGANGCTVRVHRLRALEARCLRATIAQRKRFRGLLPDRADIMPAGLGVLLAFARHARVDSLRLIEGGVRDGVMLSAAEKAPRSSRRRTTTARPKAAARKVR